MKRGVCGVSLLVLPTLTMICLGLVLGVSLPVRAEEPSPLAGNATEAAVPGGEPLVPAKTPLASTNATKAAAPGGEPLAPGETPSAPAGPDVPPYDLNNLPAYNGPSIFLKHLRTYDTPAERVFVLDMRGISGAEGRMWFDLEFITNVGRGVSPGVGIGGAGMHSKMEIHCPRKSAGDCAPEALVIEEATARVLDQWLPGAEKDLDKITERTDIRNNLFADLRGLLPLETEGGPLPLPGGSQARARRHPEIRVAYESWYIHSGFSYVLRLTFPPGNQRVYKKIYLVSNLGPADKLDFKPGLADGLLLTGGYFGLDVESNLSWEEDREYVRRKNDPDQEMPFPRLLIRRALAWTKNGRMVNILPDLVLDPFKPLPIRSADGRPLPVVHGSLW